MSSLPSPTSSPGSVFETPPTAAQLLVIWQEVLGAPVEDTTGSSTGSGNIDENFFDAGGTSLLAARLAGRIKTQLGCAVTAGDILAHPSVRALAKKLAGTEAGLDRTASDQRAAMQRRAFTNPRQLRKG